MFDIYDLEMLSFVGDKKKNVKKIVIKNWLRICGGNCENGYR